jgi:hypothetical protein
MEMLNTLIDESDPDVRCSMILPYRCLDGSKSLDECLANRTLVANGRSNLKRRQTGIDAGWLSSFI